MPVNVRSLEFICVSGDKKGLPGLVVMLYLNDVTLNCQMLLPEVRAHNM